jgi:hypothetical protein
MYLRYYSFLRTEINRYIVINVRINKSLRSYLHSQVAAIFEVENEVRTLPLVIVLSTVVYVFYIIN